MRQLRVRGTTAVEKRKSLVRETELMIQALTGLVPEVSFVKINHWADADVVENKAVLRYSESCLDQNNEFLEKLAIHEIAHIVDCWLFDGPRTRNGKVLQHDIVWKRICRLIGDPESTRLM